MLDGAFKIVGGCNGAYLVLDQELDTLNWSGGSLGDSGGDTTHQEIDNESLKILLVKILLQLNVMSKTSQKQQPDTTTYLNGFIGDRSMPLRCHDGI